MVFKETVSIKALSAFLLSAVEQQAATVPLMKQKPACPMSPRTLQLHDHLQVRGQPIYGKLKYVLKASSISEGLGREEEKDVRGAGEEMKEEEGRARNDI